VRAEQESIPQGADSLTRRPSMHRIRALTLLALVGTLVLLVAAYGVLRLYAA
jgi:hypothetical protein